MIALLVLFAAALQAEEWRNPKDGAVFVKIPGGCIKLACLKGPECPESGTRLFEFEAFWMARSETTVGQFQRFVAETNYRTQAEREGAKFTWKNAGFPQDGDHPVVHLAYEDAQAYAAWAGVALPTEAEWEYASRVGASTPIYFAGKPADDYVWHRENSPDGTHAVAGKRPNAWGLYDMIGNAWEWCAIAVSGCAHGMPRGGSWTRCPEYRFRNGRIIDALAASIGPLTSECAKPAILDYDDDRGFRCIRRRE